MQVADGAELVRIVRRAVVDDGKTKIRLRSAIAVSPFLEMPGEFRVGHDINTLDAADRREVVQHIFNHRFARDGQKRFGLREGQRVKARGVTGGQENDFHRLLGTLFHKFIGPGTGATPVFHARFNPGFQTGRGQSVAPTPVTGRGFPSRFRNSRRNLPVVVPHSVSGGGSET